MISIRDGCVLVRKVAVAVVVTLSIQVDGMNLVNERYATRSGFLITGHYPVERRSESIIRDSVLPCPPRLATGSSELLLLAVTVEIRYKAEETVVPTT